MCSSDLYNFLIFPLQNVIRKQIILFHSDILINIEATAPFGQLAISNQPSFHIPYLFRYSDYPDYTALLIKTLRQKAFHPSWQAYPGDEDNGSLSAWYIWSALGFYPICPGKPSYDLGIPLFDHLRIYLAKENKWLDIHYLDRKSVV